MTDSLLGVALSRRHSLIRRGVLAALLLCPALASAQPAPLVGSTLRTTDTSTTSIRVGCGNTGSCTGGITSGPVDVGGVTTSAAISIANNVPGVTTFKLYNNAGTLFWNGSAVAIGGSISGTTNTIPLFTSSSSIGNSIMTQSGTTITVATTLNATTLGGTLSTASQPNITGLGTISSGTWGSSATKIGLASGGTNADLSGTGGTSQFLRQNTLGGTVTVVRPAIADLSDSANVAILNVVFGTQTFGIGTTGTNTAGLALNGGSGAGGGGFVSFQRNSAAQGFVGNASAVVGGGSDILLYGAASNALLFYSNATLRWGINSAGDFTFGASNHLAFSNGTPTCSTNCSSIVAGGVDYSFRVNANAAIGFILVTFGHTWSSAPRCTAAHTGVSISTASINSVFTDTTTLRLVFDANTSGTGDTYEVQCSGS